MSEEKHAFPCSELPLSSYVGVASVLIEQGVASVKQGERSSQIARDVLFRTIRGNPLAVTNSSLLGDVCVLPV